MIKTINQIIVFCLEVAMIVAYGHFGLSKPWSFVPRLLVTVLLVSVIIFVWSMFAAPKSGHRLKMPYLAIFRTVIISTAGFLLFQSGYKKLAVALIALTIITQTISYFIEE